VTLEDFSGTTEIRFWRSNEFLKYQHLLQEGKLIVLKGERKPRFHGSTEIETSWSDVFFLAELAEKATKKLTIKVNLEDINEDLSERLNHIFTTHAGSVPIKLQFTEPLENMSVTTVVDKYKLQPSNDLIRELMGLREVELVVN